MKRTPSPMMDEEYDAELRRRVSELPEELGLELDKVARGLEECNLCGWTGLGGRVLPNRAIALACVDLYLAWNKMVWERG